MANELECSKKFTKIAERCAASAKKEMRIAKEYSKILVNYSSINEVFNETTKNLKSAKLVERKQLQKIDALEQIYEERQRELKRVREEIEEMKNKIANFHNNESGTETNKTFFEKLFKMHLVKILTKTHISQKDPQVIRGFSANTENSQIFPFEIETGPRTKAEIEDALWEQIFRCSPHAKRWEEIFNS